MEVVEAGVEVDSDLGSEWLHSTPTVITPTPATVVALELPPFEPAFRTEVKTAWPRFQSNFHNRQVLDDFEAHRLTSVLRCAEQPAPDEPY